MGQGNLTGKRQIIRRQSTQGLSEVWALRPDHHWLWLCFFVLMVALLGGSSRFDPVQSALLQPLAVLLLIPSLGYLRSSDLERGRFLCIFLLLVLVWMIIQLVPLPLSFWGSLPKRDAISEIDQLSGFESIWRPISLAPFRGLSSIFGLVVPVAALLLALAMKWPPRLLLFAIVGIGLVDATFGLLQVIGGPRSIFYMYSFSSTGAPAGIFANENHSAVFSAIVLLVLTRLAVETREHNDPPWVRLFFAPSFLVIFLAVLVTGSRAGFVAVIGVLLASILMVWPEVRRSWVGRIGAVTRHGWRNPARIALAGCVAAIMLVLLAFVWFERTVAVEDILVRSSFEDLRWSFLPILNEMASDQWLFGTGFGSFEAVYRFYEPTALLLPAYVNHAHNDWLQLAIEGGLPAIILLVSFLVWVIRGVVLASRGNPLRFERLVFWVTCIVIIAAASIVDYPLRTPLFQVGLIWLLISLSSDRASRSSI